MSETGKIQGRQIQDNSIDDRDVRLRNNQYLRARNQAGNADVNILKVNANNIVEWASGSPVTFTITAGEALAAGDICYKNTVANTYLKASATDNTKVGRCIAISAIENGATGLALSSGSYNFGAGSLTIGSNVFLGTSGGSITQSAPTTAGNIQQILGYADSATSVVFNFDNRFVEV
jgi:hypothetical protein